MGVAAVGLAISAIGTGASILQEREASKEAERAAEFQNAQAEVENRRRRIATIREGRIKRAQIIASGENQGVSGSTGVLGGAGSVQSQTATNVGTFDAQLAASRGGAAAVNRGRRATERAGVSSAIAGVGNQLFNEVGGGYTQLFKDLGFAT